MSTTQKIRDYLSVLGIDNESQDIYLALCELGPQPASIIARKSSLERTKVYRLLGQLSDQWLISTSQKWWAKTFFVSDLDAIGEMVLQRQKDLSYLQESESEITQAIQSIAHTDLTIPSVKIFEWAQIEHVFRDMVTTIDAKWLKKIRFFASNSYEEQTKWQALDQPVRDFFKTIKYKKIGIETYIGTGSLIMEHIERETDVDTLLWLRSSESSTHVFVVGTVVYIVIYRDKPIAIRLDSKHFSHVLHLLLDNIITS